MRSDLRRVGLVVAALVGGVALLAVGFVIALGGRSVVAGPGASPGAPTPVGHEWSQVEGHGTDAAGWWLGTTVSQALELRVNSARALRLEPNATSPNVIGGYSGNSVTAAAHGATISGGGEDGSANVAHDNYSTIGGGFANVVGSDDGNPDDAQGATVGGGGSNVASGGAATIGGGYGNTATDQYSTVGGGYGNDATHERATVAGGFGNDAEADWASVGGGQFNKARNMNSTVGGGAGNDASGCVSTIGGGNINEARGWASTIAGGSLNDTTDNYAAVGGGEGNLAGDPATVHGNEEMYATVGGGEDNSASAAHATVGGGLNNSASGQWATVGGGENNINSGWDATIAGGSGNTASWQWATVGGGQGNKARNNWAAVAGGNNNDASGLGASIGGGAGNTASNGAAAICGGENNTASGAGSTVGGGVYNVAAASYATVSGGGGSGEGNAAYDNYCTIGGGSHNYAGTNDGDPTNRRHATVAGGYWNTASGIESTVGGGYGNTTSGAGATVPGGANNDATGAYSFTAGLDADAIHAGAFVWSSGESTDSYNVNTFTVRAHGGSRFYTASGTATGVVLSGGGGAWNSLSDRDQKENLTPVDGEQVLALVADMPIATWNYTTQDPSIRHIGPMAQDFAAAFNLGEDERYIGTLDADGVALAAIQGLYTLSQEQAARIDALEEENAGLQQRLDDLETRVTALEGGAPANEGSAGPFSGLSAGWLFLGGFLLVGLVLAQRRLAGGRP